MVSLDFGTTGIGYFSSWNYTSKEVLERIDGMFEADMPLSENPETFYGGKMFKITVTVEEM